MKLLLTAVAMMIASPALAHIAPAGGHAGHAAHSAQAGAPAGHSTPATDPHAGHDMAGGMMDCCKKNGDGPMACCAKMKSAGKKMPCCDKPVTPGAGADPHAGHKMKPKN